MNTPGPERSGNPLVSIGLPVYNGANYIRQAVAGILGQTYRNCELIISDNASTDDTPAICAELAASDSRIRFTGNERNIGAAGNYNRVFRMANGEYFKWAAHDDILAPTFVERAVEILERSPDVVLCCSRTGRIGERGETTGRYESVPLWDSSSPAGRFRQLVFNRHACVAVFGLIRRKALERTPLIAPYVNSDRVLLAELGLEGKIFEIPEDLFFRRDHPGSSLKSYPDFRQRVVWFDPSKSPSFAFPEWREVFGYAGAVSRARVEAVDRIKCWMTVVSWSMSRWRPLLADFKYAAQGVIGLK